jgi:hypothetical protein
VCLVFLRLLPREATGRFPPKGKRVIRGLLCRRPPSGPISTNNLAPTSWKNPRPHGKDAIGRRRSHHGSGVNPFVGTGTRRPFDFVHPAFGRDQCRAERSGGRAHRLRDVRGPPRGAGGFGARHRGSPKDPGSHRGQDRGGPARARDAAIFVASAAVPAAGRGCTARRSRYIDFNIRQAERYLSLLQSQIAGTSPPQQAIPTPTAPAPTPAAHATPAA